MRLKFVIRQLADWFEPTVDDAKEAFELAKEVKEFVLLKIK